MSSDVTTASRCGVDYPLARSSARVHPASRFFRAASLIAGLKAPVDLPLQRDFLLVLPEADGEPGEIGGAERGGFRDARPHHRHAEEVGLELHQQIVGARAAVHAQFLERILASASIACSTSATW